MCGIGNLLFNSSCFYILCLWLLLTSWKLLYPLFSFPSDFYLVFLFWWDILDPRSVWFFCAKSWCFFIFRHIVSALSVSFSIIASHRVFDGHLVYYSHLKITIPPISFARVSTLKTGTWELFLIVVSLNFLYCWISLLFILMRLLYSVLTMQY